MNTEPSPPSPHHLETHNFHPNPHIPVIIDSDCNVINDTINNRLDIDPNIIQPNVSNPKLVPSVRKSTISKYSPSYLKDFHCSLISTSSSSSSLNIYTSITYPLSNYLSYEKCYPTYQKKCAISSIP